MKKPFFIRIDRQNLIICICLAILALLLVSMPFPSLIHPVVADGMPLEAYGAAEPYSPQDMDDPPFYEAPMPSRVVPIREVIAKGSEIPLEFAYNDPNWKRKVYRAYWHSTYKRWNYVPDRLHYAMHRLFTTYRTASVYYDFIHNIGIAEESRHFKTFMPSPAGKAWSDPYEKMEIVVMQSGVEKAMTYGNQIVLIARPRRTGLQALDIPMKSLKPFDPDEYLLVQLATPEADEMDYSLISIARFNQP